MIVNNQVFQQNDELAAANQNDRNICIGIALDPDADGVNLDWQYHMRREMQEIVPGLFLGPYAAAKDLDKLHQNKITHIVCVRHDTEATLIYPKFTNKFVYWLLKVEDVPTRAVIPLFQQFYVYIRNHLDQGDRILVHGNTGMSCSAALVIAFIMQDRRMTAEDAQRFVQRRRFCIYPTCELRKQLKEYEPILKAILQKQAAAKQRILLDDVGEEQSSMHDNVSNSNGTLKRSYSQAVL